MPVRAMNKLNNAATRFAPWGGGTSQFQPPTAGDASIWMNRNITIIEATQLVHTALDPGDTRTLQFFDGSLQTGSDLILDSTATSVRGTVNASFPAETLATIAVSNIARQINGGTPPTEEARIAWFYLDDDDETLSWFGMGSATQNQGISTTPEFIGVDMTLTTTTESNATFIVPADGTFKLCNGRYVSAAGSTYEIGLSVEGVNNVLGSIPPESGTGALFSFATEVSVSEGDVVSIRIVRTAGTSTALTIYLAIAFVPASA